MILDLAHGPAIGRPLVVHPDQVKGSVDQEVTKLVIEADLSRLRPALRGLHRDHDIAERDSSELRSLPLEHGEGEYIGRERRSAKEARQLRDAAIVHEADRDLGVRKAQGAEDRPCSPP